ncbi:MAG TPA: class I SAM-dependent methyltransferase [bacterium]|nr:class I SAM-dependent methyltransferase [bacterium]
MKGFLKTSLQTVLGKGGYRTARSAYYAFRRWLKTRHRRAMDRLYWLRKYGLRHYSIYGHRLVPSGFPEDHAVALYDVAKSLPDISPVLVEIGSWLGKSSVVLSRAIKNKKGAVLFCIDPFNADGDPSSAAHYHDVSQKTDVPLLEQFIHNIKRYGSYKHVRALRGYSTDFSSDWNRPIDLLFIDGNHSYESVRRDFLEWSPFIKPGGYLVMHDASFDPNFRHQDPIRVAREFVLNNSEWVDHKQIRHMLIVRKAQDRSETSPVHETARL